MYSKAASQRFLPGFKEHFVTVSVLAPTALARVQNVQYVGQTEVAIPLNQLQILGIGKSRRGSLRKRALSG